MTDLTKPNARQIVSRDVLQMLAPHLSESQLDSLLRSINADVQPPCRLDASSTPDLIVTVAGAQVSNPESNRQHSMSHVGNTVPLFASGTITFPAADGGSIVPSVGSSITLNCPVGQYVKILVSMDAGSNLVLSQGSSDTVEADALVPPPNPTATPIGWVGLHNTGGVIDNIIQSKIYQFSGGGGSGSAQSGFAQEGSIPFDVTSVTITFPFPLPSNSYVVTPQWVNDTDANPSHQALTISNKTASGFTVSWNSPTDTANYKISYIVPAVQMQIGEPTIPADAQSIVVTLPIALSGVNYSVVANLVNMVDGLPQFQPTTLIARTNTTFTVAWNNPTDSASYRLAYHVAEFQ